MPNTNKPFKYAREFEGKFLTRQNIVEHFIDETGNLFYEDKDVEEILVEHFVRKSLLDKHLVNSTNKVSELVDTTISKQEVKDVLQKNWEQGNIKRSLVKILKELGLE